VDVASLSRFFKFKTGSTGFTGFLYSLFPDETHKFHLEIDDDIKIILIIQYILSDLKTIIESIPSCWKGKVCLN